MILLIDNYDSFSYNLYQQAAAIEPDMRVVRNDALTVSEIEHLNPSHIILSPGPGYPKDAGICEEVVTKLGGRIPILGVCLGHQPSARHSAAVSSTRSSSCTASRARSRSIRPEPLFTGPAGKGKGRTLSLARCRTGRPARLPQGHLARRAR